MGDSELRVATCVIAVAALAIAYRQYSYAKVKIKLDLFDRRYAIYKGLVDLLEVVNRDQEDLANQLVDFQNQAGQKRFLFDEEVIKYLDDFIGKADQLRHLKNQIHSYFCLIAMGYNKTMTNPDELEQKMHHACLERDEFRKWFEGQGEVATKVFEGYLDFRKVK